MTQQQHSICAKTPAFGRFIETWPQSGQKMANLRPERISGSWVRRGAGLNLARKWPICGQLDLAHLGFPVRIGFLFVFPALVGRAIYRCRQAAFGTVRK